MTKPIEKLNVKIKGGFAKVTQNGSTVTVLLDPAIKTPKITAGDTTIWAKVISMPSYQDGETDIRHYVVKQVSSSDWTVTGDAVEISRAINADGGPVGAQDIRNYANWYEINRIIRIKKKFITEVVSKTAVAFTYATKNFNATGIGSGVVAGDMAIISGTNIISSQHVVTTVTDANNIICSGVISPTDTSDNTDSVVKIGGKTWHIDEDMVYSGTNEDASLRWSEEAQTPQSVWI